MATLLKKDDKSALCDAGLQASSGEARSGSVDVRFLVRVENHLHILAAFGRPVAETLLEQVGLRLDAWLLGRGRFRADLENGGFHVHAVVPDEGDRLTLGREFVASIRDFCISTEADSVTCAGQILHPALSWTQISIGNRPFPLRDDRLTFAAELSRQEDAWRSRYREGMAGIAAGFADMAQDRLWLNWQSIKSGWEGSGTALYHEALLCRVEPVTGQVLPFPHIEAMEQAGFVRALDQWLIGQVLDHMGEVRFADLGARISAQSMIVDGWWTALLDRLRDQKDHARRMVFVVSGASPFPALHEAAAFVQRVRSLGCRIALDSFGNGFASIQTLFALAPDIVKIDGAFAGWAAASDRGRKILDHAVALAGATGAQVVVNGISTSRQKQLALEAGAAWLQGDHVARPAIGLSWRDVPRPEFLAATQHAAGAVQ